jgi:predicted small secreted protein
MNSLKKSPLLALTFALLGAFLATGCNTMKGLGKDTERVGEKIQDKASR